MGEFSRKKQLRKIAKVMREFKNGKLNKSYGGKVTNRKQAIAIALSEANNFSQQTTNIVNFGLKNPLVKPYGYKTWKSIKPKLFSKKNLTIGLGSLAATGLTSYGGSKLYNRYVEKRKKWWEL